MTVVDLAPHGARPPDLFVRGVLAVTRNLPNNRFGLRVSMPFRRLAINWLDGRPVDTAIWNARMRLYPARNIGEKNALFTPQIFDAPEREVLAAAVDRRLAAGGSFTFVDIGANVGLYSLFVAARGGPQARVLAIEPQPGIVGRLQFNVRANLGFNITVHPVAVSDHDGEARLVIHATDEGGTHLAGVGGPPRGTETVTVPCRTLTGLLAEAGVVAIDALKIDIEGAEHLALVPFFGGVAESLWPKLVQIEDRPADWPFDLFGLLRQRGYVEVARSRHNVVFQLGQGAYDA
jgi:FkbM family methyltransferase